jgi:hypothetical protein
VKANVLFMLASTSSQSMELEPAGWQSLSAAVDADSSSAEDWRELVTFFCAVFKHIYWEHKLNKLAAQAGQHSVNACNRFNFRMPQHAAEAKLAMKPAV